MNIYIIIILFIIFMIFLTNTENFTGPDVACAGWYADPSMITCGNFKVGDLICKPDPTDCFDSINNGNKVKLCYCHPME